MRSRDRSGQVRSIEDSSTAPQSESSAMKGSFIVGKIDRSRRRAAELVVAKMAEQIIATISTANFQCKGIMGGVISMISAVNYYS